MPGQSDSSPSARRRSASRGGRPASGSGPGRAASGRSGGGRSRSTPATPATAARAAAGPTAPRPRFTSRAAILVLIVAVLAVSYASSLRAYLQQRSHIEDVQATIAESEEAIAGLEREKKRLDDPAYVEQQARERLGYVMPGEKPFVVVEGGEPLEAGGSLGEPRVDDAPPPAWYDDVWGSVLVAGNPPRKTDPPPLTKVTDPDGAPTGPDE